MADKAPEAPGPGHYIAASASRASVVSSSFVSQTEGRGVVTKVEKKVGDMPGPGHYTQSKPTRPSLREQHPELQYFGSTTERFKEEPASRQPGPGAYADTGPRRMVRGSTKGSFAAEGRWTGGKPGKQAPGPGQYDPVPGMAQVGQLSTASILGSTGNLAFGSHERQRGADMKDHWAPGPGAYGSGPGIFDEGSGEPTPGSKRSLARRKTVPPTAAFKSETAQGHLTEQTVKEGKMGPPPGAYSPVHIQDTGAVMRLPPKGEGFLSGAPRLGDAAAKEAKAPGPGWYKVPVAITGGKKSGTFNRSVFEGVPETGRPKGLGFESQARRFTSSALVKQPGPGAYNTDGGMITKTFNVHFGDII